MNSMSPVHVFRFLATAGACLGLIPLSSFAADYYVSPTGHSGHCLKQAPCSLEHVQGVVRAAAAAQKEDIHINFFGGAYYLTKPIALVDNASASDSGHNGFNIVWQAVSGDPIPPVLTGGVRISGWKLFDSEKNIWRADAPAGLNSRQFYVNGLRAARAITGDLSAGSSLTDRGFRLTEPVFNKPVDISKFRNLSDVEVVRLFNWQLSRCNVTDASATDINVHPICLFNSKSANLGIFVENAFELLNKPGHWYLDRTGAVGGAPSVYYIPRKNEAMGSVEAYLAGTEQILTLNGESKDRAIHDVTFKGLHFTYGTWFVDRSLAGKVGGYAGLQAGVYLLNEADFSKADSAKSPDDLVQPKSVVGGFYDPVNLAYEGYIPGVVAVNFASRIRFFDNTFAHIGATALALNRGIQNSTVQGNTFEDISGSAIQLGGVEQEDHHPCGDVPLCDNGRVTQNNVIRDNRIANTANEYFDAVGIFVGYARNTLIGNNDLSDLSYSGISLGWGWGWVDRGQFLRYNSATIAANNRIVNNRIDRFLTRQRDGAAIYTLSAQPGSVIANNFAHDGKNDFAGIYQDEGSSGFTVERNVLTGVKYSVMINCGGIGVSSENIYRQNFSDFGAVRNSCYRGKNAVESPIPTVYQSNEADWPTEVRAIVDAAGVQKTAPQTSLETPHVSR